MEYAVIEINNKQYIVNIGDELLVDNITEGNVKVRLIMLSENGKLALGKPYIKNAKIQIKILSNLVKGKKVDVFKYKAKSRYRKRAGIRPQFTKIKVEKIII